MIPVNWPDSDQSQAIPANWPGCHWSTIVFTTLHCCPITGDSNQKLVNQRLCTSYLSQMIPANWPGCHWSTILLTSQLAGLLTNHKLSLPIGRAVIGQPLSSQGNLPDSWLITGYPCQLTGLSLANSLNDFALLTNHRRSRPIDRAVIGQ